MIKLRSAIRDKSSNDHDGHDHEPAIKPMNDLWIPAPIIKLRSAIKAKPLYNQDEQDHHPVQPKNVSTTSSPNIKFRNAIKAKTILSPADPDYGPQRPMRGHIPAWWQDARIEQTREALRSDPSGNGKKIEEEPSAPVQEDHGRVVKETPRFTDCVRRVQGKESIPDPSGAQTNSASGSTEFPSQLQCSTAPNLLTGSTEIPSQLRCGTNFSNESTELPGLFQSDAERSLATRSNKNQNRYGWNNSNRQNGRLSGNQARGNNEIPGQPKGNTGITGNGDEQYKEVLIKIDKLTEFMLSNLQEIKTTQNELLVQLAQINMKLNTPVSSERTSSPRPEQNRKNIQRIYTLRKPSVDEEEPSREEGRIFMMRGPSQEDEEQQEDYSGRIFMTNGTGSQANVDLGIRPKDIPVFTGKEDFVDWIRMFKTNARLAGWDEETNLAVLELRLQGEARRYFDDFEEWQKSTLARAIAALEAIYDSKEQRNAIKLELKMLKQRQHQKVRDFASEFSVMAKRAFADKSNAYLEEYMKTEFLDKLYDLEIYGEILRANKPTFREMVEVAIEHEQILLVIKAREGTQEKKPIAYRMQEQPSSSNRVEGQEDPQGQAYDHGRMNYSDDDGPRNSYYQDRSRSDMRNKKCYECGKYGHMARFCRRGRSHCTRCGEDDHYASRCNAPMCDECGEFGHFASECEHSMNNPEDGPGDQECQGTSKRNSQDRKDQQWKQELSTSLKSIKNAIGQMPGMLSPAQMLMNPIQQMLATHQLMNQMTMNQAQMPMIMNNPPLLALQQQSSQASTAARGQTHASTSGNINVLHATETREDNNPTNPVANQPKKPDAERRAYRMPKDYTYY